MRPGKPPVGSLNWRLPTWLPRPLADEDRAEKPAQGHVEHTRALGMTLAAMGVGFAPVCRCGAERAPCAVAERTPAPNLPRTRGQRVPVLNTAMG